MECITGLKCLALSQRNEIKYCHDLFTIWGKKSKRNVLMILITKNNSYKYKAINLVNIYYYIIAFLSHALLDLRTVYCHIKKLSTSVNTHTKKKVVYLRECGGVYLC